MIISSWKSFLETKKIKKNNKFGCVMIETPIDNWEDILNSIDSDDIYIESKDGEPHGLSKYPHLTLLYGLHEGVSSDDIWSVIGEIKTPINITINGIDIFQNEEYDVLKLNVQKTNILQSLHNKLLKFPNSNEFDDYKPHITISYLKKGTGEKYIGKFTETLSDLRNIVYSTASGEEFKYSLKV